MKSPLGAFYFESIYFMETFYLFHELENYY